jgi:hypothetical protein
MAKRKYQIIKLRVNDAVLEQRSKSHENDIRFVFSLQLFVGWLMSYFYFICVCLHIVVSNTFCVVFLFSIVFILCLYSMLPVSLDCPFLEYTKGVIRIRKSKKNRQHNGQKKISNHQIKS